MEERDASNLDARAEQFARGADLGWVADGLTARRDDILARWLTAVRAQPFHARRREEPTWEHIPLLLDAVIALLRRSAPRWRDPTAPLDDPAVVAAAQAHAASRFEYGLSAPDIVTEFRLIRQEIGRALREVVADSAPTGDVLGAELLVHDAIDGAITLALEGLTRRVEEVREEFVATTVHDVQQPLTAIRGIIQLARRNLARPEPDLAAATDALRRGEAQVDRMAGLLGTLADASRLALGRLSPQPMSVDLVGVVQDVLHQLDPPTAERTHLEVGPGEPIVGEWDATLLARVVANLLSNAAKYSPEDAAIDLLIETDGNVARLAVRDRGIGLAPEDVQHLFQRFGRAPGAVERGIGGTGLGLYVCRGIVEAHGGKLWAESAGGGQGATFWVELPRTAALAERPSAVQDTTRAS